MENNQDDSSSVSDTKSTTTESSIGDYRAIELEDVLPSEQSSLEKRMETMLL